MAGYNSMVLFVDKYPADMQAEGIAINNAVLSGACNSCRYLPRCCSDDSFKLPSDAACMKIKTEILRGWETHG